MIIRIYETKTGQTHRIPISYVKLLEFTKTSIKIIYKDERTPTLTVKATQITFED